jgi:hypothetical protein
LGGFQWSAIRSETARLFNLQLRVQEGGLSLLAITKLRQHSIEQPKPERESAWPFKYFLFRNAYVGDAIGQLTDPSIAREANLRVGKHFSERPGRQ